MPSTTHKGSKYSSQDITEARRAIRNAIEGLIASDLHPYQGEWLSPDQYRMRRTTDFHEARTRVREILALQLFALVLAASLLLLVVLLCY